MAAPPTDGDQDNSEPLKYKTWVLKVSIHCEGCKRKVRRILHSVEGVYTIDVDTRQHKVVVTGNVDANTLIRKLEKSGKHAELWPDFHKVNQPNEPQHQQQQQVPQNQNQNQNPNIENQKVTFNTVEQHNNNNNNNNQSQKVAENCGPPPLQQVKEVRFEGNVAGEPPQPPPNGGGGGGGGAKKKKKKKKGHNGNNPTTPNPNNSGENNNNNNNNINNNNGGDVASGGMEQGNNGGPPCTESQPNPNPVNMSPPRHRPNGRVYEYSPPYYGPPPVYAVSYNTAYPSTSYSASYYSTPPPYSYAYVHQGGDVEASAPLDWNSHAVPPPSDSFEMFSDENPNACAVM